MLQVNCRGWDAGAGKKANPPRTRAVFKMHATVANTQVPAVFSLTHSSAAPASPTNHTTRPLSSAQLSSAPLLLDTIRSLNHTRSSSNTQRVSLGERSPTRAQ